MHRIRYTLSLILGTILILPTTAPPAVAQEQEAGHCPGRLEALNVSYRQQLREIERRWLGDLAEVADKSCGRGANDAYRQLFQLAIARNLCTEAKPAAGNCLASIPAGEDVRALAALVQVFARAESGDYEQSLADLEALFKEPSCVTQSGANAHAAIALAVGEAYLQRLIRSGRYDVARRLCELPCKVDAPGSLKDHFAARMARLDLLGKNAPVISGTGVDGHQVSLADLKGKVVLVDFGGSSCSQCVHSSNALDVLAEKYRRQGFVMLNTNLHAKHPDDKVGKTALPTARHLLAKDGVTLVNLLDCQKPYEITTACGVSDIPANFLVGRDGRIVAVEQRGGALERAIVRALDGLCVSAFK